MRARLKRWAVLLLLCYAGIAAMLWALQRRMIYQASEPVPEAAQVDFARDAGLAPWHDEQGQHLGWKTERPGAPAMLVFHGNAGVALDRVRIAHGLAGSGWSVYLMEYPGYGSRPGTPSRRALVAAGSASVDRLAVAGPVFVLGESIGSGVACAVTAAAPIKVAGLLLVTPFARLSEVAGDKIPWLPVRLLMAGEDYDNRAALAGYLGPVASVIAGRDEVVGAAQGRSLHDAYAGPKRSWEQPNAGHNNLALNPENPFWAEASAFLRGDAK